MKDLKDFSIYLRTQRLYELAVEYLKIIQELDIPLVKLVMERKLFPDMTGEKAIERTMTNMEKFLVSIEKDTLFQDTQQSLKNWEEDKLLPGISKHDIHPSDLVLIYVAQKTSLFKFLPSFTRDVTIATGIVTTLEGYYMKIQNDAVQLLFRIHQETGQRLKESEEKYRLLVQNVEDYAIYMLDPEGNIKSWNEGAEKIKGYKADEIIGKNFSTFYTLEDRAKGVPEHNLKMARKYGDFEQEGIRVRKDGSTFWANALITALYDDNGNLRGFAKITRDITEMKKTKDELERKAQELSRSNTELEQFAYVASHDLQEPLRTVSSYVQLLASRYKDKLDSDANVFINFAVDGSNRMRQLINSLLEYSRVNRVKPFEEIDLKDVMESIILDLNDTIKSTGATIKYNKLPVIVGDTVLIGQLFQNLIGNALKFRSTDRAPEITVSCEKRNGNFLFSVKDNGIGMQKEYWDKIFVIFQRLNSREQYPGTGIGLSICKKIVERHGGKIWVESEPGKGSTFYFTIKKFNGKQLPTMIKENVEKG